MSFLHRFSSQVACILEHKGKPSFPKALADLFKQLVPTDNIMIIAYPRRRLPRIEYNDMPPGDRASTANEFLAGAFLLDPFYLAATKDKLNGFFCLNDIAPAGFKESEYYSTYFTSTGLLDECGYLIQLDEPGRKFINISIGQIDPEASFSTKDRTNLKEVFPLIEALIKEHWLNLEAEADTPLDLREQLETALDCFGSSLLTDRENQIVQLILQGYSSKGIAERFGISVETVKLHRKNAYAKLDLSTQGELFNLFINSLMNLGSYEGGDPLVAYLSH